MDNIGNLADHRVYDSFGNQAFESTPGTPFMFGFDGQMFDTNTGLQYNLNRWYDATTGRWLSEDALGLVLDSNPYRFCGNDAPSVTCDFVGGEAVFGRGDNMVDICSPTDKTDRDPKTGKSELYKDAAEAQFNGDQIVIATDPADAVKQMNGKNGFDMIVISAHGSQNDGQELGKDKVGHPLWFTEEELNAIARSLGKGGVLVLGGCYVAHGDVGEGRIASLADSTRHEVRGNPWVTDRLSSTTAVAKDDQGHVLLDESRQPIYQRYYWIGIRYDDPDKAIYYYKRGNSRYPTYAQKGGNSTATSGEWVVYKSDGTPDEKNLYVWELGDDGNVYVYKNTGTKKDPEKGDLVWVKTPDGAIRPATPGEKGSSHPKSSNSPSRTEHAGRPRRPWARASAATMAAGAENLGRNRNHARPVEAASRRASASGGRARDRPSRSCRLLRGGGATAQQTPEPRYPWESSADVVRLRERYGVDIFGDATGPTGLYTGTTRKALTDADLQCLSTWPSLLAVRIRDGEVTAPS